MSEFQCVGCRSKSREMSISHRTLTSETGMLPLKVDLYLVVDLVRSINTFEDFLGKPLFRRTSTYASIESGK